MIPSTSRAAGQDSVLAFQQREDRCREDFHEVVWNFSSSKDGHRNWKENLCGEIIFKTRHSTSPPAVNVGTAAMVVYRYNGKDSSKKKDSASFIMEQKSGWKKKFKMLIQIWSSSCQNRRKGNSWWQWWKIKCSCFVSLLYIKLSFLLSYNSLVIS